MHTDSDDNSESKFGTVSSVPGCAWARTPALGHTLCVRMSMKACCAAEGPEVCYTQEDGQGQSCIPDPSRSPSSLTLMLSWDVSVGDGFPGNRLLSVLWGWCGRFAEGCEGWGRREEGDGVQSDIGWQCELRERGKQLSTIIQHASVFSFPSFSLINTGPWLKQQHEPNELPFAYTCCVKSELTPEREFTLTWSC